MLAVRFEHPLVVTSGNISHEPQIIDNAEALVKLAAIADLFLLHDREIANRIDDSVALVVHARPRLLRRARGYAPSAMRLPPGFERAPDLLAFGGELKSTFCLLKDGAAVLSQHQGDLEDLATFDDYQKNLGLGGLMLGSRSTRAAGGDPRRIVIFLEGNGTRPVCMRDPLTLETLEGLAGKPIKNNRDYGHDEPVLIDAAPLSEARALGSLAGDANNIPLVDRSALVLGLSAAYLGGGHSTDCGALSAAKTSGGPAAATIDTILGSIPEVRGTAPFDVVRVGVGAATTPLNYSSCAFDKGKPAPILISPSDAYASLFGSVASGQAGEDFKARKQLLEFAIEDLERELKIFTGSTRGRTKLETYEDSLLAMLARNEQILAMKAKLLAVKPAGPGELNPDPYASTDPLEQLRAQVDIATGALLSGLTNVVVVSLGSGSYYWSSEYPSLAPFYPGGKVIAGHDLRHGDSDATNEVLHELSSRSIGEMARMARTLAAQPEAGGTMLDNTLLLHMSDNGEQHHSNAEEWAMLMIGGNNMGFKTDGRSVTYPKSGHPNSRQTSNLFNSVLHGAGLPTDDFGHGTPETRVAPGPLTELWG